VARFRVRIPLQVSPVGDLNDEDYPIWQDRVVELSVDAESPQAAEDYVKTAIQAVLDASRSAC